MIKSDDYIIDGRVAREKIAFDIERGIITRSDIKSLVSNNLISKEFFGKGVPFKKEKKYWDKKYLNQLLCAVVADCFNEEYLYHLCDVSDYVKRSIRRNKNLKVGLGIAVIIIVVGVLVIIIAK